MNRKLQQTFAFACLPAAVANATIAAIVAGFACQPAASASAAELPVPKISEVLRLNPGERPGPALGQTSTYILKTSPRATLGDAYVIITDFTDDAFLKALDKLAAFHHGSVVRVQNLAALSSTSASASTSTSASASAGASAKTEREQLMAKLRELKPKFVAIAPRPESYTDDLLPGIWKTLAALDNKSRVPQLPVFPGLLVAPNQAAFEALVERSINHKPQPAPQVRPFVVGQIINPTPNGMRSLQKVRMMRALFGDCGTAPARSLVVRSYSAVQSGANFASAPDEWRADVPGPAVSVEAIPTPAKQALDDASLLIMFGHGRPGEVCSIDVRAFRDVNMAGKVVLCGDCFTAPRTAPQTADATPAKRAGPKMSPRKGMDNSFAMRAVQNGAAVVYAHMRENAGFPHLFPVLENWTDGLTVGEAYQRLMNAILAGGPGPGAGGDRLLYVIIGDPALQPFEKMKK